MRISIHYLENNDRKIVHSTSGSNPFTLVLRLLFKEEQRGMIALILRLKNPTNIRHCKIRQKTIVQTTGPAESLFTFQTQICITAWACSLIVQQSNVYYISFTGATLRSNVGVKSVLAVELRPAVLWHLSLLKQTNLFIQHEELSHLLRSSQLNQQRKCFQLID